MLSENILGEIESYLAFKPYSNQTRFIYRYRLKRFHKWSSKVGYQLHEFDRTAFLMYSNENHWAKDSPIQRHAYHCIQGYLKWKLGENQPLTGLRILRKKPGPQRTLNAEERDQVVDSLLHNSRSAPTLIQRNMATRNLAIFSLGIDTGLRSAELCTLRMQGLDIENRRVCVLGKRRKWRFTVFSKITQERIHLWLSIRRLIAKPRVDSLFVGVGGKKPGWGLSTVGLRCIMTKIARESGVKHFTPHALRRTMATHLIRNGAPTRLVQSQGGWARLRMIERYTQDIVPADIAPFFATSSANPSCEKTSTSLLAQYCPRPWRNNVPYKHYP